MAVEMALRGVAWSRQADHQPFREPGDEKLGETLVRRLALVLEGGELAYVAEGVTGDRLVERHELVGVQLPIIGVEFTAQTAIVSRSAASIGGSTDASS